MPLEHPEVRMPPPLLHLGGLLVGYGLDQALNWSLPAFAGRQGIAATLALIAIAVLLTALLQLARARTTVMPHRAARTRHLVARPKVPVLKVGRGERLVAGAAAQQHEASGCVGKLRVGVLPDVAHQVDQPQGVGTSGERLRVVRRPSRPATSLKRLTPTILS